MSWVCDDVGGGRCEPRRQKEFLAQNGPTIAGMSWKIETLPPSVSAEVSRLLLKVHAEMDMPGDGNAQPGILVTQ